MHDETNLFGQHLGFDSCAIFYIGGIVEVKMQWDLRHIDILAAVAGDEAAVADEESDGNVLDVYSGTHHPGQPWKCYRSVTHNERECHKNLRARLRGLLTPSTSPETIAIE